MSMALCGIFVQKVMLMKCTTLLSAGMQVTVQIDVLFSVKENKFSALTALCSTHWSHFVIVIRTST